MTDQKTGRPETTPRPRQVTLATYALLATALFSILLAVSFLGQKDWLKQQTLKANTSAVSSAVVSASKSAVKKKQDVPSAVAKASASATSKAPIQKGKKLDDSVGKQVQTTFLSSGLTLVIIALLAFGVFRGRHWARWAVTGFFVIGTFTGIGVSVLNLVTAIAANSVPAAIRLPLGLAALAMTVAVVLVNLRPSVEYFALTRPAPRPGQPQRRGLFAPRPPRNAPASSSKESSGKVSMAKPTTKPAQTRPADSSAADGARAKKRANAESIARGAELARSRAKASKSRRTER